MDEIILIMQNTIFFEIFCYYLLSVSEPELSVMCSCNLVRSLEAGRLKIEGGGKRKRENCYSS